LKTVRKWGGLDKTRRFTCFAWMALLCLCFVLLLVWFGCMLSIPISFIALFLRLLYLGVRGFRGD